MAIGSKKEDIVEIDSITRRVRHRRTLGGMALAGALVLVTACGATSEETSGASPEATGPQTLKLTTLGLCNEISVYWAQEKELFTKHGVKIELVKSAGGAAGLTALQSGDVDLAFTNPFSTMLAISRGIGLQWIATAYGTPTSEDDGTNSIAISKDSGITSAKDLEGKTIGVNEVGGINQIITTAWLKAKGADPSTVKFVALPFAELASAVASGKIAASQVSAQNLKPELGLKSLGDPFVAAGNGKSLVFAGYVATTEKSKTLEPAMKGFQAALIEANEQIKLPENQDERFALSSSHCKQEVSMLKTIKENPYLAEVDTSALEQMAQLLKDQGMLPDPPTPDTFVPSYVVKKS
ncbi:ABC transporter substrate-binding protein [Streptosporangium sp. NBC_01755]|uniref:ABC transporter substrate-binding protein n=1 Tax=unclassified Streptosporangium TaxID=2632669 RepID=UPI002DDC621A|nr:MULTISPECIES: ABC transporter substrate-binding protein [unclassified Streptosporangium]WSA29008.1 ABC transporter substrate-binding protein [Streptosporangium sp. NBC_01810]WSC99545.1 ABC transporter substrate-binding protein [Streptosporangium sp. NBC_01755]